MDRQLLKEYENNYDEYSRKTLAYTLSVSSKLSDADMFRHRALTCYNIATYWLNEGTTEYYVMYLEKGLNDIKTAQNIRKKLNADNNEINTDNNKINTDEDLISFFEQHIKLITEKEKTNLKNICSERKNEIIDWTEPHDNETSFKPKI